MSEESEDREAEWNATMAEGTAKPKRQLRLVAANGIKLKAPRWLFDRRIPSNAIALLAGREGIGKSTIAFDLAARVTRGTLPGRFFGQPRGVAIVASEDSWESVILPRLMAANADLSRVFRIDAVTEDETVETISAPTDLRELAKLIAEHDIALLIIDPIMSIIHGSLDTHKDREVRQALDPLARFCGDHELAALGLIHVNKSDTTDPLNSIMASRAFSAVARSVLYCILDPDAGRDDRYLFGHPKSNLGPQQATFRYHLIEVRLPVADAEDPRDAEITTSRVIWDGEDARSIRDVMERRKQERPKGELNHRIIEWLGDQVGAASAGDIAKALPDVSRNTIDANLARMVKRGELVRAMRGMYALPTSAGTSDTSLETVEVSVVSEGSVQLTDLTDLTAPDVSEMVSGTSAGPFATIPYCRKCGFDLDSNGHHANCKEAA